MLDANVLEKPLQMNGIRLLRKMIEVENKGTVKPAADWDSDEMEPFRRLIKV